MEKSRIWDRGFATLDFTALLYCYIVFCLVGVAFCMSGLDSMYVSLVGEGEEEKNGPDDPMVAPPQDPAISLHHRIGESSSVDVTLLIKGGRGRRRQVDQVIPWRRLLRILPSHTIRE
jgi:hypothetical protein